jgi:hypothetical protein
MQLGIVSESTFFRLKMIGNDGKITYSHATLLKGKKGVLSAYTKGSLLFIKNLADGSKVISIYSAGGHLSYQQSAVYTNEISVDVSHLPKGVYYLSVSYALEQQQATFVVK